MNYVAAPQMSLHRNSIKPRISSQLAVIFITLAPQK
uniref:Uncharacterized protein n=1 Tax=Rhizophora mucronata TaxID=61149 RepID=A0A2P2KJU8_RHIMU